jgi:hypothetical protein
MPSKIARDFRVCAHISSHPCRSSPRNPCRSSPRNLLPNQALRSSPACLLPRRASITKKIIWRSCSSNTTAQQNIACNKFKLCPCALSGDTPLVIRDTFVLMGSCGFLLVPLCFVDSCGFLWVPINYCGFLLVPLSSCGFL